MPSPRGGLDLNETLANLESIVTDGPAERRTHLHDALRQHNLALRPDSIFCATFINGTTDASLLEVVTTMRITSYLFTLGHAYWSQNAKSLENHMRQNAKVKGSWADAYDTTIRDQGLIRVPVPRRRYEHYYDSDDSAYDSDDSSY